MHRGCPVGEEDGHFFGCLDRLFFIILQISAQVFDCTLDH
jgi:hypothetical protein